MIGDLTNIERTIALDIINTIQPDEIALAAELLKPPRRFRLPGSTAVGYGVDVNLELVTPYVTMLVAWAYGLAKGEIESAATERARSIIRKAFGIKVDPPPAAIEERHRTPVDQDELRSDLQRWGKALDVDPVKMSIITELVVSKISEIP